MLLLWGAAVPLMSVCQTKDSLFTVKITAPKMPSRAKIYLLYQEEGKKIIDSAVQTNGLFVFKGKIDEPKYSTLVCDTTNIGLSGMIKKQYDKPDLLRMYIYPGHVALKTSSPSIADATFAGRGINYDHIKLEKLLNPIYEEIDKINLRETHHEPGTSALNKKLDSLSAVKQAIRLKFIIDNPDSFIALSALDDYAGISPDIAVIEPMLNRLSVKLQNTPSGIQFRKFLSNQHDLNPGKTAPVFIQNDTAVIL